MRDHSKRLDELIVENKKLYDTLSELKPDVINLKNNILDLERSKTSLIEEITVYKREIVNLKKDSQAKENVRNEREKVLKK